MRVLSKSEFQSEAEPILRNIFACDDETKQSFPQSCFLHKIIFYYHCDIDPPLIDAIVTAAEQLGDTGCYLYGIWEFVPLQPSIQEIPPRYWYIPLSEFQDAYITKDPQFDKFNLCSVFITPNFLFSSQGKWGVMLGEGGFGLLSGLPEFVEEVQKIFPEIDQQVYGFLNHIKIDYTRVNIDWLPVLLERMYGQDTAQAMLTEAGF